MTAGYELFGPSQAAQMVGGPIGTIGMTRSVYDRGLRLHQNDDFMFYPPESEGLESEGPESGGLRPIDVAFVGADEALPPRLQARVDAFERNPGTARRWPVVVPVIAKDRLRPSLDSLSPDARRQRITELVAQTEWVARYVVRTGLQARNAVELRRYDLTILGAAAVFIASLSFIEVARDAPAAVQVSMGVATLGSAIVAGGFGKVRIDRGRQLRSPPNLIEKIIEITEQNLSMHVKRVLLPGQ